MEDKKLRVLLIDDEPGVANTFKKELTIIGGFDVVIAPNGTEGLARISEGGFDVVLLDFLMPKVDGLEVLKTVNAEPEKYPAVPIIVLTNLDSDEAKTQTEQNHAFKYLVKTDIKSKDLIDAIHEAVQKSTL
jgi:CheY-like chemotaxis protein